MTLIFGIPRDDNGFNNLIGTPLVQSAVTVSPVKATTPTTSVPNTICQ